LATATATAETAGGGPPSARARAPAKINLYLHLTGRRPDGYHLLDSLVVFADIADEVALAPAERLAVSAEGPFAGALPDPDGNLVARAARWLAARTGREPAVALRLRKNLPVAAGLGGGSADAAAALRLLQAHWRLPAGALPGAELAAALGADLPVCLAGRSCFVGGIGELLAPAPALPALPAILVNPGIALETRRVFAALPAPPAGAPARFAAAPADVPALVALLAARGNDLEPAAIRLAPAIARTLARLRALPEVLLARMSGSGASCFALFADPAAAQRAAVLVAAAEPGWWCRATRLAADRPC
jgi:4-diphosphocytidyl-2-C-methyl-D-erythritol kinase